MSAFESNRKTCSIIWMGTEFDHINNVWVFPKREFNGKTKGIYVLPCGHIILVPKYVQILFDFSDF